MDRPHTLTRVRISKLARTLPWMLALVVALLLLPSSPAYGQEGDDEERASRAPVMGASMSDSFLTDADSDGKADTNDVIRYTVVVQNSGPDPATGVTFNDTIDSDTTLVSGSVNRWPVATNDTYQGYGNTRLTVGDTLTGEPHRFISGSVKDNDVDLDGEAFSVTAITNGPTTLGGSVTMDPDGTFTYTPPVDTTTTNDNDTFTYTVTDVRGGTDTGTVTITLQERIWYVDDNGSVTGDGRSHNPFNTVTAANLNGPTGAGDVDAAGDYIFVHSGSYSSLTAFTLEASQKLYGEPHGLTLNTHQLHPAGNTRPVLNNGIVLANTNEVREFNITNPALTGIAGSGITGSTIEDVTISGGTLGGISLANVSGTHSLTGMSIQNPTGTAFDLNGTTGTPAISYSGSITKNNAGRLVSINGLNAGSATFNGGTLSATNSAGTGVSITNSTGNTSFADVDLGVSGTRLANDALVLSGNNASSIHSFTALDIFTNGGRGIVGSGAGTLNVTGGGIDSLAREAIDLSGLTFNATFSNVTVNNTTGGSNAGGINISSSPGTKTINNLSVTIDGASANDAGTGVFLNNAGTFNVPAGTIAATDGTAFNAQGNTALGVVLTSVNASNATNGIFLSSTTGSFTVNGTGSAGTGGTIQTTTGDGASFTTATNITLRYMNFNSVATTNGPATATDCDVDTNTGCHAAIDLISVTNATLQNISVGSSGQNGINANNVTAFNLTDSTISNTGAEIYEHGVRFHNLNGTNAISGTTVQNSGYRNLQLDQLQGTATLNITNSTLQNSSTNASFPGDGFLLNTYNSANMTVNVNNVDFTNHLAYGMQALFNNSSVGRVKVFNDSDFQNNNIHIDISASGSASLTYNVTGNDFTNGAANRVEYSHKINSYSSSTNIMHGLISDNDITGTGSAFSDGSSTPAHRDLGTGIRLRADDFASIRVEVNNNRLNNIGQGGGIDVIARNGTGERSDVRFLNNHVRVTYPNALNPAFQAIFAEVLSNDTLCAQITGNDVLSSGSNNLTVRRSSTSTFLLDGHTTGNSVSAYLNSVNTTNGKSANSSGTITGHTGGCTAPTLTGVLGPVLIEDHAAEPQDAPEAAPAAVSAEAIAADTRADEANRFVAGAAAQAEEATADEAEASSASADERGAANTRNVTSLSLGDIPSGGDVTLTFDVLVGTPAVSKNYIVNQGAVSGSNISTLNTVDTTNPGPSGTSRTPADTPPTVAVTLASGVTDPTNDNPVNFTVTFAEPVTDFDDSTDVTVGGTSGADTAVITGSGDTYNVAVSGMDNDGTVTLAVNAGAAVDEVNNANLASPSAGSVTYDGTAPTVTVNRAAGQDATTNLGTVNFIVVFNEAVTDFAEADVSLTGLTGTVLVTGSGTTYNVAISGLTGDGTITASVPADSAHDAAGNGNTASTGDNSVTVDITPPTVTIAEAAGQDDPTDTSPINFTVQFSEAVTGFADGDVTLSGSPGATASVTAVDADTYTVSVSGMADGETVEASIGADVAEDSAGNGNTAAPTSASVTYDATGPTVTIDEAALQNDPTNASPINFAVVFSEPVADFDDSDVAVGGTAFLVPALETATVAESGLMDGTTYNVQVSGMDNDGTVTISIAADSAHDAAGNGNAAPTGDNSVTYDTTKPTVTVERAAGQADPTNVSPINFTVQFSEPVTNLAQADISMTAPAGATATLTGSGDTYNVAVSGMTASGNVAVSIPADVAQDAAGNTNTASSTTNGNDVDYEYPLAANLAGFTASPTDSEVLLSWETTSEHNNAGFNLYRSTDANTSGEQLNDALIASEAPDSSEGFSYDWMDNDVEVGVTYYYWLETVSTTGETQRHGPVSATVQVPTSVTLGSINAGAATPSLWMFAALGLTALAALTVVRRRA